MNKIVIVGGGTAGWITALYAQKAMPKSKVTVIESSNIGILGAGEGTVPHLINFFDYLEIPISDFITNTKTTIKNGIKFTNWGKKDFYHTFIDNTEININKIGFMANYYKEQLIDYKYPYSINCNKSFEDYQLLPTLSKNNKVPFSLKRNYYDFVGIERFDQHAAWSIHFDAKDLADFLKNISISRGIKLIDSKVEKINLDKNGYITTLELENNDNISLDFVFDCTGFRRLIIGDLYKSKWISHNKHLPVNKAIPFFLQKSEKIEPYTESIAMKCGWMWKIPLQHRYGCGYVFDSNIISDDYAKKEIDEYFGFEVDSPKTFSFDAGCYKEIWKKNCIAIGLSGGFIEPLEATSIWQSFRNLRSFFSINTNQIKNKKIIDSYNKQYLKETREIVDFLYLHYTTKKNNSVFWKNFTKNNQIPDFVEYLLDLIEYKIPEFYDIPSEGIFQYPSYMQVLFGNNLINKKVIDKYDYSNKQKYFDLVSEQIEQIKKSSISIEELIYRIYKDYEDIKK